MLKTISLLFSLLLASDDHWVQELGGRIERNSAGTVTGVYLRGAWVSDSDLEALRPMKELVRLDLALSRISDQGLLRLRDLRHVADLDLYYAEQITDEGASALKDWKLVRLNLKGTKITDTTLELLSRMPTLTVLDIGYAQATDSGSRGLPARAAMRISSCAPSRSPLSHRRWAARL